MSRNWNGRQGFQALLCELFDEMSFRQFMALGVDGEIVCSKLPGQGADLRTLIHEGVQTLLRHGGIEPNFFMRLIEEFPKRASEIRREWNIWQSQQSAVFAVPELNNVDSERRKISLALELAQRQRDRLAMDGLNTGEVDTSIIEHRRALRHGAKLKPLDFLDARYCLLEVLGSGGFATVWRALDRIQCTEVAVKVLHTQHVDNPSVRRRFSEGAVKMAQLQHPNIIKVLRGTFDDGGYVAYVMEYIEGGNLRDVTLQKKLSVPELSLIFAQVCHSLHHAHQHRFIHRDVKPSNILLAPDGTPRLTDFDLIKSDNSELTNTGSIVGTLGYMAPEVLSDAKAATVQSDIYSLGMTLLFCLIGSDPPINPSDRGAWLGRLSCPQYLREICERAVATKPLQRPSSTLKIREMLLAGLGAPDESSMVLAPVARSSSLDLVPEAMEEEIVTENRGRVLRASMSIIILAMLGVSIAIMFYLGSKAGGEYVSNENPILPSTQNGPAIVPVESGSPDPSKPKPKPKPKPTPTPTPTSTSTPEASSEQDYVDKTMYRMVLCATRNAHPRQVVEFYIEFDSHGNVRSSEISEAIDNEAFIDCANKALRSVKYRPAKNIAVVKARYDLEPR